MDQPILSDQDPGAGAIARSQVYHLLSTAFRYPTAEFFRSMVDGDYWLALVEAMSTSPHHDSLDELLELSEEIEAVLAGISYEGYEVLFAETFEVGAPMPPCPPYEGLQRKTTTRHSAMLRIAAFYKHFGLKMDQQEGKCELPDHITAQLEFLHFLAFKESQAREAGDKELLTGYLLAQNDFLQRHCLQWVPAFSEKIEEIRPGTALALFAEITTRVLQEEADLVSVYLKELGVDIKPVELEKEEPVVAPLPVEEPDAPTGDCAGCIEGSPE